MFQHGRTSLPGFRVYYQAAERETRTGSFMILQAHPWGYYVRDFHLQSQSSGNIEIQIVPMGCSAPPRGLTSCLSPFYLQLTTGLSILQCSPRNFLVYCSRCYYMPAFLLCPLLSQSPHHPHLKMATLSTAISSESLLS
jgi:hypothetical protein